MESITICNFGNNVSIKYSKNLNNEKPLNPIILAEKLQKNYEESFNIFSELLLEPLTIEPNSIGKYKLMNFTLQSTQSMPLIYVSLETLSKYTLHCSMRIDGGVLKDNTKVYQTPFMFRMKLYLDARLLEVYDASLAPLLRDKKESEISPKLLNPVSTESKLIKSNFLNAWLVSLKNCNYRLLNK